MAIAAIVGCGGSKVTKANYDLVKEGMSEAEVVAILGPGTEQASSGSNVPGQSVGGVSVPGVAMSGKALSWQDGQKVVTGTFVNGKLVGKAQHGL